MFKVTEKDLLAARGESVSLARGDRVELAANYCGDGWGKRLGTVERVASKPDPKGRMFVDVLMDEFPSHNGKETREGKNPPLPRFESGLLRRVEE